MNDSVTIIYARQVPGIGPVKMSRKLDLGHYGQTHNRDEKVREAIEQMRTSISAHAAAADPFVKRTGTWFDIREVGEGATATGLKFRELEITPR